MEDAARREARRGCRWPFSDHNETRTGETKVTAALNGLIAVTGATGEVGRRVAADWPPAATPSG
jgi:hypothetical protein